MSADAWRDIVNEQLAELGRQATATLDRHKPAPDGLPARGSWIRAVWLDDDLVEHVETPWHYVVGWDGMLGMLSTRCRRRPGRVIAHAVSLYVNASNGDLWWRRSATYKLRVEGQRPLEHACRQCDIGLERDAAREVAAVRAQEVERLVGILPTIEAIATDASIDDAERGRRLREAWPA